MKSQSGKQRFKPSKDDFCRQAGSPSGLAPISFTCVPEVAGYGSSFLDCKIAESFFLARQRFVERSWRPAAEKVPSPKFKQLLSVLYALFSPWVTPFIFHFLNSRWWLYICILFHFSFEQYVTLCQRAGGSSCKCCTWLFISQRIKLWTFFELSIHFRHVSASD